MMKTLWICFILTVSSKVCAFSINCVDNECQCVKINVQIQCPRHLGTTNYKGILLTLQEKKSLEIDCCNIEKFHVYMLPNVTIGDIKHLTISSCPLSSIKKIYQHFKISNVKIFHYFGNLENATLSKKYYFDGFNNLEEFKLERINFTGTDDDIFENMPKLNTLIMERNKNLSITPTIFKNLTQLKILYLSNNELEKLPDKVFENLTNLQSLHLWGNRLTIIKEDTFYGLTNLKSLEISTNNIQSISNVFKNLSQLTSINLSNNKIIILDPQIFKNNKKIRSISIRSNKNFALFDHMFDNLPLLEKIDLSSCNLSILPTHIFGNSTNLKEILLNNNNLRNLSSTLFSRLVKLEILDLSRNMFSAIDENLFENLTSLEEINLRENQIRTLQVKTFHNNKKLKIIDLSHNKFVGGNIFEELHHLEKLDLSYNLIENLNAVIPLKNSSKHFDLNLSHNAIKKVNLQDLQFLEDVFVDLEFNNLNKVVFSSLKDTQISLSNNKINCNCEAFELLKNLKTEKEFQISTENFTCRSPSNLQKLKFESLELLKLTCPKTNGCPNNCSCHWRPFDTTIVVDCSSKNFTKLPEFDFDSEYRFNQTEVHLEDNFLTVGPSENLRGYKNVTKLFMSRNHITKITWLPPKLEVLTLDNNYLNDLDNVSLNTSHLSYLTLGNNQWKCDCGSVNLAEFLRTHSLIVYDHKEVFCVTNKNQLLISLNKNEVCFKWVILVYSLAAVFLGILIIILLLIGLFYKYQYQIKFWLFGHNCCMFLFPEEKSTSNQRYDAFISFAPEDEEFVVQNLLPVLEESYKICLPIRDFVPGEFKTKQVTTSILDSRRTLVVLSQNFLQSVWGEMEIRTAHTQAMTEEKNSVFIVLYGDIDIDSLDKELKMYLQTNTYVKWGDSYFWYKLKYALPHNKCGRGRGSQKIANVMSVIDDKFILVQPSSPNPGSTPPLLTLDPGELRRHPLNSYSV